jgi:hypothetical protein
MTRIACRSGLNRATGTCTPVSCGNDRSGVDTVECAVRLIHAGTLPLATAVGILADLDAIRPRPPLAPPTRRGRVAPHSRAEPQTVLAQAVSRMCRRARASQISATSKRKAILEPVFIDLGSPVRVFHGRVGFRWKHPDRIDVRNCDGGCRDGGAHACERGKCGSGHVQRSDHRCFLLQER